MKISFDYEILINEIQSCLASGELYPADEIQILREHREDYSPVVDWYYSKDRMKDLPNDGYLKDLLFLESVKVSDFLAEMQDLNSVAFPTEGVD